MPDPWKGRRPSVDLRTWLAASLIAALLWVLIAGAVALFT